MVPFLVFRVVSGSGTPLPCDCSSSSKRDVWSRLYPPRRCFDLLPCLGLHYLQSSVVNWRSSDVDDNSDRSSFPFCCPDWLFLNTSANYHMPERSPFHLLVGCVYDELNSGSLNNQRHSLSRMEWVSSCS